MVDIFYTEYLEKIAIAFTSLEMLKVVLKAPLCLSSCLQWRVPSGEGRSELVAIIPGGVSCPMPGWLCYLFGALFWGF